MTGGAISRNDVMAMMGALRAEVEGNLTTALGTAISQLRVELTASFRKVNDRALTSIQEHGNALARYQEGLTAAIEITAEAKFHLVNAHFFAESERISALIQAQSEATTQLSENIKKEVVNIQEKITSIDSGKFDLVPGMLADHAAVNQKCLDVAGATLGNMHDRLRQDFLEWTTQASQKIGALSADLVGQDLAVLVD